MKSHRLTKGPHQIAYIPIEVLKESDKVNVLKKINEIVEDLQKFKHTTIKACCNIANELMKKLAELLDHIREVELLLTNIKTRINLDKAVNNDIVSSILNRKIKINEFSYEEIISKITENLNYKKFSGLCSENKTCFYESHAEDEDNILFVKINENNLYSIDLNTLTSRTILNMSKCWVYGAACKISTNKYFISGGRPDSNIHVNTSIIDIKDNSEKILKNDSPKYHQSCILKNNQIYIFGGYNGEYLKSADKFDLKTKSWSSLSDMPVGAITWSSMINNKILIVGYHFGGAYVYHENNYSKNLTLPHNHYNINEEWIIGQNKLFECVDLDKITWQEYSIAIPSPGNPFLNITVRKNSMIYIMIGLDLWRVDTVNKSAEKLVYT